MKKWEPISEAEFSELYQMQKSELSVEELARFEKYSCESKLVPIRRSPDFPDEKVYVVAENMGGVLYFDDVEYGFNIAVLNADGVIDRPGGNQGTLAEAVAEWF